MALEECVDVTQGVPPLRHNLNAGVLAHLGYLGVPRLGVWVCVDLICKPLDVPLLHGLQQCSRRIAT